MHFLLFNSTVESQGKLHLLHHEGKNLEKVVTTPTIIFL
jgi:hypothetical protein